MKNELIQALLRMYREAFPEVSVKVAEGTNGWVLILQDERLPKAPEIPLELFLANVDAGKETIEEAIDEIRRITDAVYETVRIAGGMNLCDYESVRQYLAAELCGVADENPRLASCPYTPYGDFRIYYRLELGRDEQVHRTIRLNNDLLKAYGLDMKTLYRDAMENQQRVHKAELFPFADEDTKAWVLSTKDGYYGAIVLAYPGVLAWVREKLNSDFWIIPSSVHELIVVPVEACGADLLIRSLHRFNRTSEMVGLVLSDDLYYYSRGMKTAVKWEENRFS